MRRISLLIITLVMSLFAFPSAPAHACTCSLITFDEATDEADFIAEVTIRDTRVTRDGVLKADVIVERVWKGDHTRETVIVTNVEPEACGTSLVPDTTQFVLAIQDEGRLATHQCLYGMGNFSINAEVLTDKYGSPTDLTNLPVPEKSEFSSSSQTLIIIASLILAASMIGLVIVLVWRQRLLRKPPSL